MLKLRSIVSIIGIALLSACANVTQKQEPVDSARHGKIRTDLAVGYLELNKLAIAREELRRALELAPNYSRANQYMALLQLKLKNPDAADVYFKTAIRLDPENSAAAHDYGVFLCRRGHLSEALTVFDKAISNPLYPRSDLSNMRAGECLIKENLHLRGEKYIRNALKQNSRLTPALYDMAVIQTRKKNFLSARGYIERYFSIGHETLSALVLAMKIEHALSSSQAADVYQQKILKQYPSSNQAQLLRKKHKGSSK